MGNLRHYPQLLAQYPLLATSKQALRWATIREDKESTAVADAQLAENYQGLADDIDAGTYGGDAVFWRNMALDAWGEAINGGIVVC